MPTRRKNRGNRWMGRLLVNGKPVGPTKMFGAGEKYGKEWTKAKEWELQAKADFKAGLIQKQNPVPLLLAWAVAYLEDVQRKKAPRTFEEAQREVKFFLEQHNTLSVTDVTPAVAMTYLQGQFDSRSGCAANKARKNLCTAWNWGKAFMDGFPVHMPNPFEACSKFKEIRKPRYVPSAQDWWAAYDAAEGQDKVMLATFYYLVAPRKRDVFNLTWDDLNLRNGTVNVFISKYGRRVDLPMCQELKDLLLWWRENRMFKDHEHVFLVENSGDADPGDFERYGQPFAERRHFLKRLCKRAGVRKFDFHAIRHRRAIDLYKAGNTRERIQQWFCHADAGTTDRYLKRLGQDIEGLRDTIEPVRPKGSVITFPKRRTPEGTSSEGSNVTSGVTTVCQG